MCLRPLHHKLAEEVAYALLDIFRTSNAQAILQIKNGREYAKKKKKIEENDVTCENT